jgi:hypothetical protein
LNQQEAMQLLLSDRVLLIETLVKIENKDRQLVPFALNPIQRDMISSSSSRDIYVKPAQVGASSLFICDYLLDCITVPGTVSIIISYDEFITGRLLRKAQGFYNILNNTIPGLPTLQHKSTYEKVFEFKRNGRIEGYSSFYIASARSFDYGRGEAIHDLLADEYAFWPPGEAEKFVASALQRVPLLPNTKVRVCSTPNGEDNEFHEMYMAAKEGKEVGKSVYTSHFYPWWMHPEYSMPADSLFVLPGDDNITSLSTEESNLLKVWQQYELTDEEIYDKLRWRRYKQAEMSSVRRSGESRFLFGQEYPEDDVSCFLAAGDMVYDANLITDMAKKCYPAPVHNLFADVWYPPEPSVSYLVAIDPGEGKQSESVATVWKFLWEADELKEAIHCATMPGFYAQDEMAEKSIVLAKWYNGAMIANEDALGFTSHVAKYGNLYYRHDPITGRVGKLIGWQTNTSTKPFMITELGRYLSKITTHDIRLVSQLRNIRWMVDAKGRDRAVSIGADDYHDSAGVAIVCRTSMPVVRGAVGTYGWPSNWGVIK